MSKSATEQYQIKKKRKNPNTKHDSDCLINYNQQQQQQKQKQRRNIDLKFHKSSGKKYATFSAAAVASVETNTEHIRDDDVTDLSLLYAKRQFNIYQRYREYLQLSSSVASDVDVDAVIVDVNRANVSQDRDKIKHNCCLRDRLQVQPGAVVENMPLSQGGFYVKGALASRRAGNSALKLNRLHKSNENATTYNLNVNLNNNNSNINNNNNNSNALKSLRTPAASVASAMTYKNTTKSTLNNSNNNNNNLHLSYLLCESLASRGRLYEAFDWYAIVASEQLDGYIPLERLCALASSLTTYVRQLDKPENIVPPTTAAAAGTTDAGYSALESAWKAKFAQHASATAAWNMSSPVESVASGLDTLGPLDLHAPSRELRVPSPALSDDYDPLLCPLCRGILRCPVTTNCGHTFCRQCCETITMCNICHVKFPKCGLDEFVPESTYTALHAMGANTQTTSATTTTATANAATVATAAAAVAAVMPTTSFFGNHQHAGGSYSLSLPSTVTTTTVVASTTATATTTMASTSSSANGVAIGTPDNMKFMPDVLVRRLVEKWWGADLQAQKINETAASYMHLNLLDEALKYCNASLDKSSTNFKSLLLRAEVLHKLNHFQSSLADAENALKSRYTSAKAHYLRALALSELNRFDEALYATCLAISMDKSTNLSSSELFQHDLSKILQKLLAQVPKRKAIAMQRNCINAAPYSIVAEHRLRRKQIALLCSANGDHAASSLFDDDFDMMYDVYDKPCDEDILNLSRDYMGCLDVHAAYADIAKQYELPLRRQASRKHFRRKGNAKEIDLMSPFALDDARCSVIFRSVLERTQQEVQRLKRLESSGESVHKQQLQVPTNLIDASDFDCVLCCRTFWKPVVTPCGHTYCWVCLDRCMDYTSSCPLCKSPLVEPSVNMHQGASSPVPFILAKRPVTKFLEAAMKRFIPDSYEKRFHQEMDMEPSVPVFICTTAFPYVPCPLFVYEPRYRLMVRRAVESGEKQFGIVQPHSGKSRYFDVGTILDIRDCVLLGDGCSILSTIGWKRFKILARNEKDGYETAKVEYIYDETIADDNVKFVSNMHAVVLSKAVEWFESLNVELKQEILQSFGEMPPVEDNWESIADGPAWAWWIIALLPLSQQLKVDILATTSLEKRLRAIEKTLDCLSGTLRRTQQNCDVVQQQQRQQQQQQQQQQQPECDNELAQGGYHTDECCLRTTTALNTSADTTNGEHSQHLML